MTAVRGVQCEEEWGKYCTLWGLCVKLLVQTTADLVPFELKKQTEISLSDSYEDSVFDQLHASQLVSLIVRTITISHSRHNAKHTHTPT